MDEAIVNQVVELLRPLKGTGEPYHDEDKFGPDEPIREVVAEALKRLDVDGHGACRLCAS